MDIAATFGHLGFHEKSEIPIEALAITIIFPAIGFITLFTSFLLQKFCPDYAVLAVLVGAICVQATLFLIVVVLLLAQLDPVVRIFTTLFITFLVILCCTGQDEHKKEGVRRLADRIKR
ncbi:hypothetical protein Nepgr_017087 [Nepenthes gracilis]|uniref:Uncharacterized protein n=1 Tax=Nepenthes gracilis TaxID=150966 RepID=A0AAD3SRW7_NEPGR|nr:hypothetical protein Nepgr_017087 [Nepenthes gracilis]